MHAVVDHDDARPKRPDSRLRNDLGFVLALLAVVSNLSWAGATIATGDVARVDFGSFVAAGQAMRSGLNPYGVYPLTFHLITDNFDGDLPNLNPPISVYPLAWVAGFDPAISYRVWDAISLGLFIVIVVLLGREYPEHATFLRIAWALSLAGVWHTLQLGQIYGAILLAGTGAWLLLRHGAPAAAGVLIGILIAVKPNFLLWPLLLWFSGVRKTAIVAFGCAATISAIPLIFSGPEIYWQWLSASLSFGGLPLAGNASLPGLAARLGMTAFGYVLAALAGVVLLLEAKLRRPSAIEASALGILASLLVGPISWPGYTLLLLPWLFGISWGPGTRVVAILLAVPFWLVLILEGLPLIGRTLIESIYNWALLTAMGVQLNRLGSLRIWRQQILAHFPARIF
jgi:hypothetical protein